MEQSTESKNKDEEKSSSNTGARIVYLYTALHILLVGVIVFIGYIIYQSGLLPTPGR